LTWEQTVNERLVNDAVLVPIDGRSNTVRAAYRPEARGVWPQMVVWLPRGSARRYGPVDSAFREAFGVRAPEGRVPLLLHPQPPAAHRHLAAAFGRQTLREVWATPTASYRSVLAWRRGRAPVVLKLSMGAVIGRIRRALREVQVARGVLMSRLFDLIPPTDRERLGIDWFSETAGVVETSSRHGWLLRRLPDTMTGNGARSLVPVFSLISRRGARPPLLVDLIRRAGLSPEEFVIERLVKPYVRALSYLLLEQGIQVEGHAQNVLVETSQEGELTGRFVLRDLSDTSINIALRLVRRLPFPVLPPRFLPESAPFPLASIVADYHSNFARRWLYRAYDTVERYGLWGFVWPINTSLARFFGSYDVDRVEDTYLVLWQQAVIRSLGFEPMFRNGPKGLATDETLAYFLRRVDWRSLGAVAATRLPDAAEPVLVERRARRRPGLSYERLDSAWGALYLSEGLPAFFHPAF